MASRQPTRGSSVVLFFASVPILGLGVVIAPWTVGYWQSTWLSWSASVRESGEFALAISTFLIACGLGGIVFSVRDFIVGPGNGR